MGLQVDDVFKVTPTEIYAKKACSISIDETEYDEGSFIETATKLQLPGILEFNFEELKDTCHLVINYMVDLNKTSKLERDGHLFTIYYEPNELVLSKDYKSEDGGFSMINKLVQGGVKFIDDPKILLNILMDNLKDIDLVYLETIVSNMFRVADNESEVCRLKGDYKDSTILGASKQPFVDSWKSALAFQHIEKAIQNGLIKGQELKSNPIENVLDEDFHKL